MDIISACGLDCYTCECYEATKKNDLEKKKEVAAKWSETYGADISPAAINCDGCMSNGAHINWCNECPIRTCVTAKGYTSCADCADFPCPNGEFLYKSAPATKETIMKLKANS